MVQIMTQSTRPAHLWAIACVMVHKAFLEAFAEKRKYSMVYFDTEPMGR